MKQIIILIFGLIVNVSAFSQMIMLDTTAHIGFYNEFVFNDVIKDDFGVEYFSTNANNKDVFSISIFDSDTSLYKMTVTKFDDSEFIVDFMLFSQSRSGFVILFSKKVVFNYADFDIYNVEINGYKSHYSVLKLRIDYESKDVDIYKHEGELDYKNYYLL